MQARAESLMHIEGGIVDEGYLMSKLAYAITFSLAALALAGCQEAPMSPNVAAVTNPNYATSGVCGALNDCPSPNAAPYAIEGVGPGGP